MTDSPQTAAVAVGPAYLRDPFRLTALGDTGLLGTRADPELDRLAALTARLLGVPIALVSLVDADEQRFPGLAGVTGWAADARHTPHTHSFCQHVVAGAAPFVVADTATHPLARGTRARTALGAAAYAGMPLTTRAGDTLGALCAIDVTPRRWTPAELTLLAELARVAVADLELRTTTRELASTQAQLAETETRLARALDAGRMAAWEWTLDAAGACVGAPHVSAEWGLLVGCRRGVSVDTFGDYLALIHPLDRPAVHLAFADAAAGHRSVDVRYRIVRSDGDTATLHDRAAVEYDDDRRAARLVGILRRVDAA